MNSSFVLTQCSSDVRIKHLIALKFQGKCATLSPLSYKTTLQQIQLQLVYVLVRKLFNPTDKHFFVPWYNMDF